MQNHGEKMSPEKMINQAKKTKGYLLKKSNGILGGWKERYFLILNGAIMQYTDEALEKLKGEISFKNIKFIVMKGKNEFTLKTASKEIDFKCHNQKDRDLWVASINLLKENMTGDRLSEKFLIKRNDPQKNCNPFQICSFGEVKKVLVTMKLTLLASQLEQTRIHQRIFCQKVGDQYLVLVSIKALDSPEVDEEILNEKYIDPFSFNKFYKVYVNGAVQDISKMSHMQSLKTDQSSVVITFADKKKFLLPYKNQSEAYQISKKICRCYEVSKEYYNPFKIVLRKNIDRHVYLFDNFRVLFEEQLKYRIREHLQKYLNCTSDPVQTFLKEFRELTKDLIETEEALKVLTPPRDDIKSTYFKITHQLMLVGLSSSWENLFSLFCPKNLIRFSLEVYEYWIVINQTVSDSSLILGCWDLNRFFIGRIGDSIKEKIHSFNAQKVEYRKIKNEPIGNELTLSFLEWLKQVSSCLGQTVPMETIFKEYCSFFTKHFDQFLEYLTDISEKWNENLVIIGACNDLSRIKNYFQKSIGSELCKGIVAEKKFAAACANGIIKKIDETIATLIKRVFLLVFITIDKRLLVKPFLEVDFGKICYEVLQRLEPFNNKVFEDVGLEILILSFDEICLFLYTIFMSKSIPQVKNIKEHYLRVLQKGLTEIEQYYCNIKTESQVKPYLKQIAQLRQALVCPQEQIANVCSKLYHTFEASFTKQNISTILEIRQTNKQRFSDLLEEVTQIFSIPLSDDSQNFTDCHSLNRNRFSVSESVYAISLNQKTELNQITKEGYLDFKTIVKGTSNFYSSSYFRIVNGKLVEYYSQNESERSVIELSEIDHCYLNSTGQQFVVISNTKSYFFKAKTRDDAGLWVQAIYSQIRSPLFENKNLFAEKGKNDALFKNLEAELTTTSSHQWKIGDNTDDQKILQLKERGGLKEFTSK